MTTLKYMGTICLDFDGVIHAYRKGLYDGTCYDKPEKGAFEAILAFQERGYSVVILSTRDVGEIWSWLKLHGAPFKFTTDKWYTKFWEHVDTVLITNHKKAAKIYVDDRGYRFPKYSGWSDQRVKNIVNEAERVYD